MFSRWLLTRGFYLQADDAAAGGDSKDDGGKGGDDADSNKDGDGDAGKTFTQADVDRIIDTRLKRERKDAAATLESEKAKAAMTEADRLKAEKAESEKKASDAQTAADKRVIAAEAKVQASTAGVKPEALGYVLKLADLSDVTIGDDGEPDAAAIKAAIETVLKDVPALKGTAGTGGKAGSEFGGNGGPVTLTEEAISKMTSDELKLRMPEVEAFYKNKK
jgi:hypothetical protein